MDNVSKAILMAGSVFIAIGVMGYAIYFFTQAGTMARQNDEIMTSSQIASFNRFYTSYTTGNVRVVDALNLLNRAVEDGLADDNDENVKVTEGDATPGPIQKDVTNPNATYYFVDNTEDLIGTVNYSYTLDARGKVNTIKIEQ